MRSFSEYWTDFCSQPSPKMTVFKTVLAFIFTVALFKLRMIWIFREKDTVTVKLSPFCFVALTPLNLLYTSQNHGLKKRYQFFLMWLTLFLGFWMSFVETQPLVAVAALIVSLFYSIGYFTDVFIFGQPKDRNPVLFILSQTTLWVCVTYLAFGQILGQLPAYSTSLSFFNTTSLLDNLLRCGVFCRVCKSVPCWYSAQSWL